MIASKLFSKENKNVPFNWIDPDFIERFGDMEVGGDGIPLTRKKLGRVMTTQEILDELKPDEVTLADFYATLENLGKDIRGIFFIRNSKSMLCTVSAFWRGGSGWYVGAGAVTNPVEWFGVLRVFSRNLVDPEKLSSSNSMTLEHSDASILSRIAKVEQEIADIKKRDWDINL